CLVMATPALLFNYNRSLLGSTSLLTNSPHEAQFLASPAQQHAIAEVVGQIRRRHVDRLGLVLGGDSYEYPFWQDLVWSDTSTSDQDYRKMKLYHRGVSNPTAILQEGTPED